MGERARWAWGPGEIERQHHGTLLADGTIMAFDNGPYRGWSRIIRMEPASNEIRWAYEARPRDGFVCPYRGSAQPLGNGNVLVTHSFEGRAFEVTPAGEIVWAYRTPATADGRTPMIYRMTRVQAPSWLAEVRPLPGTEIPGS